MIIELFKEYNPKTLILPKIDDSDKRRSGRLKRMMASIKKLAKKYRIKVIEIILITVYETLIPCYYLRPKHDSCQSSPAITPASNAMSSG